MKGWVLLILLGGAVAVDNAEDLFMADWLGNGTEPTNGTTTSSTTLSTSTSELPPPKTGPIVNLTYGTIEGFYLDGEKIAAFQGVPYAAPPVGKLRFKPPEEPLCWANTSLAVVFGHPCMQPPADWFDFSDMSEDCLTLNVYKSNMVGPEKPQPVMVYIHGGGLVSGSGMMYGGDLIAPYLNEGVIVVTINYRLGVFGFLSTNTSATTSNLGLWDQIQALKWVQQEIPNFGGDPSQVTIFGGSSGAKSVSLLTYSPEAKGLFTRVIAQSGSASDVTAIDGGQGFYYNTSRNFLETVGCASPKDWEKKNFKSTLSCLEGMNATEILKIASNRSIIGHANRWGPVLDGKGGVLPDTLDNLRTGRTKNIAILLGTNKNEGFGNILLDLLDKFHNASFYSYEEFNRTLHKIGNQLSFGSQAGAVRSVLDYVYRISNENGPQGSDSDPTFWIDSISQAFSDRFYFSSSNRELWATVDQNITAYAYSFDYASDAFPWPTYKVGKKETLKIKGVAHGMEIFFLFPGYWNQTLNKVPWTLNAEDNAVSAALITAWTNFAKNGNPGKILGTEWNPASLQNHLSYLSLSTAAQMSVGYHRRAYQLWDKVIPEVTGVPSDGPTPVPPKKEKSYAYAYVVSTWLLMALLIVAVAFIVFGVIKTRRETMGYGSLN